MLQVVNYNMYPVKEIQAEHVEWEYQGCYILKGYLSKNFKLLATSWWPHGPRSADQYTLWASLKFI